MHVPVGICSDVQQLECVIIKHSMWNLCTFCPPVCLHFFNTFVFVCYNACSAPLRERLWAGAFGLTCTCSTGTQQCTKYWYLGQPANTREKLNIQLS